MEASVGNIRLSILGQCRLLRELLGARLRSEEGLELIASADSLHGLLGDLRARTTQVLLVCPGNDPAPAWQTMTDVHALLPAARVVVLVSDRDLTGAASYIEAGAVACVEQSASCRVLVEAIQKASQGRSAGSLQVLACVMRRIDEIAACRPTGDDSPSQPLSDRETEVANLLSQGMPNKQIARRLHVTTQTVKTHVHNVLRKLQMRRRREVMQWGQAYAGSV
jgi:DNA-binding NarL/FixJ family response regulator